MKVLVALAPFATLGVWGLRIWWIKEKARQRRENR